MKRPRRPPGHRLRTLRSRLADLTLDFRRRAQTLRHLIVYFVGPFFASPFRPRFRETRGPRLRRMFEDLGLTYVKLGQFLAMRFDVLPEDVCRALARLFEDVTPVPTARIRAVVESELGGTLEELFAAFTEEPVAAASVAQVHEAWTHEGERVAVKVQRPGIERVFASDMRSLGRLARLADKFRLLGALSVSEIVDEFGAWTRRELDFVSEGKTAERLRDNALSYELVPRIEWSLTTSRVLTMEFVEGTSLSVLGELLAEEGITGLQQRFPGLDVALLSRRVANACLRQIFVKGFFHGDPHPGNILVREDNTVAFVDFGIFGELPDYQREQLAGMIENIALGNIDRSFSFYASLADPTEDTDLEAFERDAKAVLQRWYEAVRSPGGPASERHLGRYAGEMTRIVRRNRLRVGAESLLFWRALHALDSTAVRMGSMFDLVSELRRFFESIRPGLATRVVRDLANERWLGSVAALGKAGPTVSALVQTAGRGQLALHVFADEAQDVRRRENRRAGLLGLVLATTAAAVTAGATASPTVFVATAAAGLLLIGAGAARAVYT